MAARPRPNSVEYGNSKTTTLLPSAKCTRPLFQGRTGCGGRPSSWHDIVTCQRLVVINLDLHYKHESISERISKSYNFGLLWQLKSVLSSNKLNRQEAAMINVIEKWLFLHLTRYCGDIFQVSGQIYRQLVSTFPGVRVPKIIVIGLFLTKLFQK